ncbi:hypothetical protein DACRYDRAFT_81387 [Dacryopinax primogenitus]|uniref:Uncharacterized protein n=1 Tax=Dacryopinax primogenitus (strain DJM 731) TaxID=1858805 RepID=M5FUD0_DACPD|nr:uncharacterized protein DACRYDRAFT_81387 [Dacryopinax primogenitus]EJT99818.1 hypothetical protein DACRYDRAFT_81387 [Dacryopinax primogenitus]
MASPSASYSLPTPLPEDLHPYLQAQQRAVLSSLHQPSARTEGAEGAVAALSTLLRGTVERGEGNSCLVLGPRGCGKTRSVELALKTLPLTPLVVRLSGLTHPDDRSALRELHRQVLHSLGQATLPANSVEEDPEEEEDTAPFAALPPLQRPLVVLLSEFDVFCLRPRQALLYVLLDAVQGLRGGGMGIAVVGMTSRIDCVNLLEKRVKSRFSHRIIRVTPTKDAEEYIALTRELLTPELSNTPELEDGMDQWVGLWSKGVEVMLEDKEACTILRQTWELVHDIRVLQRILTELMTLLTPSKPWPTSALLSLSLTAQRAPNQHAHVPTLPAPALGLLIAVHQAGSAGHDVFTFQLLEHTYRAFARDHAGAFAGQGQGGAGGPAPRESLLSAFDDLVRTRIFTPAALAFAPAMREFSKYRCTLERVEIEDAVKKGGNTGVKKWLKSWSGR